MSDLERPDTLAFRELEALVRQLLAELDRCRRRTTEAEGRLRQVEAGAPADPRQGRRIAELERENARLRARLEAAKGRARDALAQMQFLRQQHAEEAER